MGPLRLGIIGCGYWGPHLIRNFHELPSADVLMVADMRPERRRNIERQFPYVQTVASHEEVLANPAIQAVVIATPIRTHYSLARLALQCGKHVLIEKPLATRAAEAEDLIQLAERHGVQLMVGHTFEYNPAVEALRCIVRRGDLGNIHYIDTARLNLGLFQQDVNVLWDLAPHDVSIILYLLGEEPLAVSAHGRAYVRSGIEDVSYLDLEFPHNIMAHSHVSWLEPCKVRRVTLVGDQKMAVYNDVSAEEKIKIYDKGVSVPEPTATETFGAFQLSYRYGDITSPRIAWREPLSVECSHFVECVQTGQRPRSDGYAGLRVVRVLEKAEQSLALGGLRVSLSDEWDGLPPSPTEPASQRSGNATTA